MPHSIIIYRASKTCPSDNSSDFPYGSCCFRWNENAGDWEQVSCGCTNGGTCPTGAEGVHVEGQYDGEHIRIPCVEPEESQYPK